jgi:uncharacterized glyoxalase superfamily protein PhnB
MSEARIVSSEVVVAVDASTAFTAFTEEMDLWWVRGPINFWSDAGRVVEVRCEGGVGGRILEVLDDQQSGDVFVRARITVWEPGVRVGWESDLDDVRTEVRFSGAARGTLVTVEHRIPADGADRGGTAWSRVVPNWFGAWCERRAVVPHDLVDIARLSLGVYYARPAAAARWLADVFGFAPSDDLPEGLDPLPAGEHGHPWIEFRIGNAVLNVFPLDGASTEPSEGDRVRTHVPWVYVDDLEAHFAHAKGHGAAIVEDPHAYPGSTVYVADDLEGNRWTFSQARPTMR